MHFYLKLLKVTQKSMVFPSPHTPMCIGKNKNFFKTVVCRETLVMSTDNSSLKPFDSHNNMHELCNPPEPRLSREEGG